jgi:hypothetical protein
MKFTTKLALKKDKPEEKYDFPVLTQHSYNVETKGEYTKFELNLAAMLGFEFQSDTPNVNKINWGVDEETGTLLLANTKGLVEDKISNISAKNIFSNQSFMDRLVKEFSIDPLQIHEFKLNLQTDESDIIVGSLELIVPKEASNNDFILNPKEPMSNAPLEDLCGSYHQKINLSSEYTAGRNEMREIF